MDIMSQIRILSEMSQTLSVQSKTNLDTANCLELVERQLERLGTKIKRDEEFNAEVSEKDRDLREREEALSKQLSQLEAEEVSLKEREREIERQESEVERSRCEARAHEDNAKKRLDACFSVDDLIPAALKSRREEFFEQYRVKLLAHFSGKCILAYLRILAIAEERGERNLFVEALSNLFKRGVGIEEHHPGLLRTLGEWISKENPFSFRVEIPEPGDSFDSIRMVGPPGMTRIQRVGCWAIHDPREGYVKKAEVT
jgi:DNA repair exonuclease SbcCD ATPase subunit